MNLSRRVTAGLLLLAAAGFGVPVALAQTGGFENRTTFGNPTGPTPVAGGINAQAVSVNGTPVLTGGTPTPAPTDTPAATATPRATATQEAQGYDFSTATPAVGCILDAVSITQVDCVAPGTAITPAPTATPIPAVATTTPIPAPTLFPTVASQVLLEGKGSQGVQAASAGLTANTPVAGSFPYCSAGGAGCVMAWATPIPAAAGSTTGTTLTNSLGSDVPLNNTANYFDGPSVAQGTSGTWLATGTVTVTDTGAFNVDCKLWDGTTVIDSARANVAAMTAIALSGRLATPAGNMRISCKDETATTGNIKFNASGNSKDATLTVVQLS